MKEVHIRLGEELSEIIEKNEPFRPKQESKYSFLNKEVASKQEEKFRMIPGKQFNVDWYFFFFESINENLLRLEYRESNRL